MHFEAFCFQKWKMLTIIFKPQLASVAWSNTLPAGDQEVAGSIPTGSSNILL